MPTGSTIPCGSMPVNRWLQFDVKLMLWIRARTKLCLFFTLVEFKLLSDRDCGKVSTVCFLGFFYLTVFDT